MLRNKSRVAGLFGLLAVLALFAALLPAGAAQADEGGATFVAQSRAAGLSADKAGALQAKADAYLAKLGSGATQVAPDRIEMTGAQLVLAVPGEAQRSIACPYYYFCAYDRRNFQGDYVLAENCAVAYWIPFTSTDGSWKNNQTPGTRARVNYFDTDTHWYVPGAYSEQSSGMGWYRVGTVDPC